MTIPYRWLVHIPDLMRQFILVETAWAWAGAVAHHRRLSRRYPANYRMIRFEDLVREPEATVERLCAFLGIEPEPRMLRQKVVSSGSLFGRSGFDAGAADRWRTTVRPGRHAGWTACWERGWRRLGYTFYEDRGEAG